jgi:hypothetical protein
MMATVRKLLQFAALVVIAFGAGCARRDYHPMVFHYGSPWTQAEVDGQVGYYLIDTGASVSVVDTLVSERAGSKQVGVQDIIATTGDLKLPTVATTRIDFAGRTHWDRMMSVQDFGSFKAPGGRRQSGLIGSDFFLEYTLVLDIAQSRVRLTDQAAPLGSDMSPHRMRMNGGIPEIQVFFGPEQEPVWAKLDTGSGYASEDGVYLDISSQLAERLLGAKMQEEPDETVRIVSLAGRMELPIYSHGPVRILGRDLSEVRLVVHDHGDGAFSRPDMVLVTGSVLREFSRVELDYPNRTVWVRP